MDQILKKATGNKDAHLRRAGSTTFPENAIKLAKGQIDFAQLIQSVITPAVGAKEAIELGFNVDLFTKKKMIHRLTEGEDLKNMAIEAVAPLNAVTRIVDNKIYLKDYLLSMAGVSMSDPNKGKLYNMKDSKSTFQAEFDKMYAKDPDKALEEAKKFNDKQIKDLKQITEEEDLKELPQSIINEFIITSVGQVKQGKNVEQILSKTKSTKRKKFSILEEK
jgi:hypothetical protein